MEFDILLWIIAGVIVVATVSALAPRVGVVGPLVLTAIGIGVGLLPFTPNIELDPEIILVGILPPLLYAAAVSLPAMEFRRDLSAIGGLSVVLVVVSSFTLGGFFFLLLPDLGLPLSIALGAILSPTDAVATSIVKRLGISPRIVTVLEGESLFNDATALVLLRTAIAATAGGFSLWSGIGEFGIAVIAAVAVGLVVGWVNLRVRAWIGSTAASTALSFVVPYIAYIASEHLHGSGLVSAVVAGIVTGSGATRHFRAEQRLSDRVNWRTIELVLEGAVFLIMGLEVTAIVIDAGGGSALGQAALLALGAIVIILVVRTLWVTVLVMQQRLHARRRDQARPRFERATTVVDDRALTSDPRQAKRWSRWRSRVERAFADWDYYDSSPVGWREGGVLVWAGMRGAVTLAAAQTLPHDTPHRSLLILIAFLVAVGTLTIQGGTLSRVVHMLGLGGSDTDSARAEELTVLRAELTSAAGDYLTGGNITRADGTPYPPEQIEQWRRRFSKPTAEPDGPTSRDVLTVRLAMIAAQRQHLATLASSGRYSTASLRAVLEGLDADELSLQTRLGD